MSDVTVEVEAPEEESSEPEVVVVQNDDDIVMDATTVTLVERVTRLEDTVISMGAIVENLVEEVASLHVADEVQQEEIVQVAEEVAETAAETADAVEEVVEDIDEASPEITPDELPTVREHFFFRKWGSKK